VRLEELQKVCDRQQQENQALKSKLAAQKIQIDQLLKLINGFKSERHVSSLPLDQPTLFDVESSSTPEPVEEQINYTRLKKQHHGRNKLPEHLPVKEVIIEPEQDVQGLTKIGEEITETLEYTPASLVKRRTIRPKYAQPKGEGIIIGQLPTRPIEKSIAEASLLSHILVSKYVDHLPLYRQIQIFKRDFGWQASQSTFCDWVSACCSLLEPLYNTLKQKIISSAYIQADESPIKVLDKDKAGSTHQGYQWVYHSPLHKLVLFNYRKGRGQQGPKEILENYQGYLQCDGYKVYDKFASQENIILVGCLVHARRKFFDAQDNDPQRAKHALNLFSKIYTKEKQINQQAQQDLDLKQKLRLQEIVPLIKAIKSWIEQESLKVLPKSAIGKAMTYYLKQYHKFETISLDSRLELDNNLIENAIRPLALGRKNYLFAGSHKAAQNTAMLYSFFGSCKINNVNPRQWLQYVLENVPDWNIQNLNELLPDNFSEIFKV
jgi:transposase